tara:strand:+ start:16488 stop:16799 length:312 start_codon:yes stop_codon:yes gene_type:complete
MSEINITDAYITSGSANGNTALGTTTQVDTLIVVAHKAAETENASTVYLRKVGGTVKIPLEPGDVLSVTGPNGEEFTLSQWEICNKTAGDGCGFVAIDHSPFD